MVGMTIEQVFRLLDNGFSADDIKGLINDTTIELKSSEPEQQPAPQENQEQQPAPQQEPEHQETVTPDINAIEQRMTGIEASIEKLVKTIQATNLRTTSVGTVAESLDEQTDKIMASIIRPEHERK